MPLGIDNYINTRPVREQRFIRRGMRYLDYLYAKQQAAQQATPCGDGDSAQPATTPNPTSSTTPAKSPSQPHSLTK